MSKKLWITIKRGLSTDPKHRKAIGDRVWLFMHMIDKADWETGVVHDWKDKDEADDMAMPWRTLQGQRQELAEMGYIACLKRKYGQDIVIHNWTNPRSYGGETLNAKPGSKSTEKSVHSDETESTPESTPESTDQPNSGIRMPTLDSKITDQISDIGAPAAQDALPLGLDAYAQGSKTAQKPKAKRKGNADPRSSHPAIVALHEIMGRYPKKEVYDQLIRVIGETPNMADLKACFEAWTIKGWRPDNYTWVTEWYVSGIPAAGKNGTNGASEPKSWAAARNLMAKYAQEEQAQD